MNEKKYCIISDHMSAEIALKLMEQLNSLNISFENKCIKDWQANQHEILFTCSINFAQEVVNKLFEGKIFLITDQMHELLPESIYAIGSDQIDFLSGILDLVAKNNIQVNTNRVLEEIISNYQKALTKTLIYLNKTNEALNAKVQSEDDDMKIMVDLLNIFNVFLEFENKLFGIFDTADYFNHLNSENKKNGFFENLEFLSLPKLLEIYPDTDFAQNAVYPLNPTTNGFVLIKHHKKTEDFYQEVRDIFFIRMINEFIKRLLNKEKSEKNNDILEKTLSLIPYPLALFGQNNELILYNSKFLQMNILPSVCTRLGHEEKYEHDGLFYKIYRKEFNCENENYVYYSFVSDKEVLEKTDKKISSSELGIISSSIAHELNNPLAGILAAIDVLLLDDNGDTEMRQSLVIMQDSAKRSKELVEIFLGFSKKDPRYYKSTNVKTSFILAINLLRFRMIESSVRLEMSELIEVKPLRKELNSSVMAMIFYIILGEMITIVSKMGLINSGPNDASEEIIKGGLLINDHELIIQLETALIDLSMLTKLKLLNYLIEIEALTMEIQNNCKVCLRLQTV
ncbi:MAG: hypothetical protein A2202_07615 [Bdellovibrionales bacterium RIFOXYA1_FULL_36_14]|nr:MAG: hypothetical protein A2202_07615 [Bdellovibrionales bacterium RIFOXYA1_FULL_36_14]